MTLRLVLPARPPREGKQRLASVLTPDERETLNRAFFERTLSIACAVLPPAAILVVSRSDELLARAGARGAEPLRETGTGLNAALEQAAAHVRGAALLSLSCDLSLLESADLEAMIADPADVVLAPDRAGTGTNALLVRPAGAIPYRYGPGSAAAHRDAARGARFASIQRTGLACDIDTPDDLAIHHAAIATLLASGDSRVA